MWNECVTLKNSKPSMTKREVIAAIVTNTNPGTKELTQFMSNHKWMMKTPNSIRQRAVGQFFSAKKSAMSNVANGHQKRFAFGFKSKKTETSWTLGLEKAQVSFKDGKLTMYPSSICSETTTLKPPAEYRRKIHHKRSRGKKKPVLDETRMRVFEKPFFQGNPQHDPTLHYDGLGRYFLIVHIKMTPPVISDDKLRLPIVGCDPGTSEFMTTFSTAGDAVIIKEPVDALLRRQNEIDHWKSVMTSTKWSMALGSKKTAKRRIRIERRRFRDFQYDFHHQLASHLSSQHSAVFVERPQLVEWRKNLSTATRRRMDAANMSVFFDRLEFSCKRRGCLLPKTKEAFTTVGCSGCGGVREMPKHARRYHCEYCGLDIDRNVNSAKNVILTNLDVCEIPPTESERFVAGCCFRPGPRLLETSG